MYVVVVVDELDDAVGVLLLDGLDGVFRGHQLEEHRLAHEGRAGLREFGGKHLRSHELIGEIIIIMDLLRFLGFLEFQGFWDIGFLGFLGFKGLFFYQFLFFYFKDFIIYTAFSQTVKSFLLF